MNREKEVQAYLRGELSPQENRKYEIARELGVLDRVLHDGWKSLSAKETGRIGGLMTGGTRKSEKE
ncbi:MAG: alpha/beta-type small acid-soluble spore protein [Clostridiales bacterium]|nr:alpha/beta-type small acid-soluble spore protein [Clostridiales bacterium]